MDNYVNFSKIFKKVTSFACQKKEKKEKINN